MNGFIEGDYDSVTRLDPNKKRHPKIDPDHDDMEVFLLDFYPYDEFRIRKLYAEEMDGDDDDEDDKPKIAVYNSESGEYEYRRPEKAKQTNKFVVRATGLVRTRADPTKYYSISLDLEEFEPFFFFKIPDNWRKQDLDMLIERLKTEAASDPNSTYSYANGLKKWEVVISKPFYGYTANDKFQYAMLVFENSSTFGKFRRLLEYLIEKKSAEWAQHQLYESNIEPMLRLNHIQEIIPSGWIHLPPGVAKAPVQFKSSDCQLHFNLDYRKVVPMPDCSDIPPLQVASFDIEADSSHGDFPIAAKNYQKLAQDIVTEFLKLPQGTHKNPHYIKGLIHSWLILAFNPIFDNNNINRIQTVDGEFPTDTSLDHLAEFTKKIADQYHQTVMSIKANGFELGQVRGYQEYYISKLQMELENYLPELEITEDGTGNYALLAEQLLKENHRMMIGHRATYMKDPIASIRYWITLAFHPYYDNHNINRVYTKRHALPTPDILENLVPQVYAICMECHKTLNKPKQKKKSEPKIKPKKFMTTPPEEGQTKLGKFIRRDKHSKAKLRSRAPEKEEEKNTNNETTSHNEPTNNNEFKRGRYIKPPPQPYLDPDDPTKMKVDRIGRDFYVKWMHELFDLHFPDVTGDPVIQIGTTFKHYGEKELFLKHIVTLKGCSKFTNRDMVDDENRDIFITKPKDAIAEAEKLKLETPLIAKIKERMAYAAENNIKKPDIPELVELNQMLYIARRDRQMSRDNSVLRVECYETEGEVLLAWRRLIKEMDPDIITGYNIFGFDFKYMWDRAEVLGVLEEFRDIGRIRRKPEELVEKKLVSSGLGDNLLYFISMTGRVVIDLLKVVQSGGYRLPIYKLDFVTNHFLYKRKNDLPPQQIFILQKGNDDDRATIARYCLVDCILCNRLIDKLEIITNNIGMSRVCKVPLSYLFLRGQGIKIQSLVSDITRKEGYLIKAKERVKTSSDDWYEGAIVLDPAKGIYFEPCVVADFNSLYPSCMIAWNLSHDSFVELGSKYDNLPEGEYYDVEYDEYKVEKIPGKKSTQRVKVGVKTCRFYQPPDGSKSMLPRILQRLLGARKDTRKEQKNFKKGTFEWNVKEGLQLAYKVTANSLYGQVGAKTSAINLKEIAACTTACGRGLIYKSKKFCEENYKGCTTVYGDSVTGDTPIFCLGSDGKVMYHTIEEIGTGNWKSYHGGKEECSAKDNLLVWTERGFTKINRVIRHKTEKQIYRILTHTGLVDVTEDHSLLDPKGIKVKPSEVKVGTELLHSDLKIVNDDSINVEEAYVMGLFYGDGSCGSYSSKYGVKNTWAINNQDMKLLDDAKKKMEKLYPSHKFKILDTMKSSGVYKLVACGDVKSIVENWREKLYSKRRHKRVPVEILNGSIKTKKEFMRGYYAADGDNDKNGYYRFDNKGKIGSAGLFYLNKCLGKNVSINDRADKSNVFRMTCTEKKQRKNPDKIKRIRQLNGYESEYVYDLETDNHHFNAGIGRLVVHNTDSVGTQRLKQAA